MELSGTGVGSWAAAACSSSMLLREFQEPAGNIPILGAAVPPVKSGTKSVRTPHAAAPRAKAPVQETSAAGEAQGCAASSPTPTPTPTPPVGGEAGLLRAAAGTDALRRATGDSDQEERSPPQSNRIWIILFFFNPIESNPKLSKANGYPYPTKSKST